LALKATEIGQITQNNGHVTILASGTSVRGSSSSTDCHTICCWSSWSRSKFFKDIIFFSKLSARQTMPPRVKHDAVMAKIKVSMFYCSANKCEK